MHPIHLDKTLQIVNINHTQISTITAVSWGEKKKKGCQLIFAHFPKRELNVKQRKFQYKCNELQ